MIGGEVSAILLLFKIDRKYWSALNAFMLFLNILIPDELSNGGCIEFKEADLAISDGSFIRVIRAPYFGRVGTVKSLPPELKKMESETMVRVAEIEFEDGTFEIIPRANLEMILT